MRHVVLVLVTSAFGCGTPPGEPAFPAADPARDVESCVSPRTMDQVVPRWSIVTVSWANLEIDSLGNPVDVVPDTEATVVARRLDLSSEWVRSHCMSYEALRHHVLEQTSQEETEHGTEAELGQFAFSEPGPHAVLLYARGPDGRTPIPFPWALVESVDDGNYGAPASMEIE